MNLFKKPTFTVNVGINRLNAVMAKAKPQSLQEMGEDILWAADNVFPKIPVDTGELRASAYVDVKTDGTVEVGYKAKHAAPVHEMLSSRSGKKINWTRAESGPRFLSSKLDNIAMQDKYRRTVISTVSNYMRNMLGRFS